MSLISNNLAVLPIVVSLSTGVLTFLFRRYTNLRNAVSLIGGASVLGATLWIAAEARNTVLIYRLGGDLVSDNIPFGILLEIDQLSAFMMAFAAFVMLVSLVYSVSYISDRGQLVSYHTLWHFLGAGVMGAFSTGDLFNLFVWFEVLLMSSYILAAFYSNQEATRST
ncbi:MAG: Na+/H+ antiporter subunit D, partial [Halobacteria archaeon]|nr:Na+/H+ antiporter subunit D [Halobacteria archaeon]